MRLLVTGGAGYIGSVVASLLVEDHDDLVVLDGCAYEAYRVFYSLQ